MAAKYRAAEMVPAKDRPDVLIPPAGLCSNTALRKAARRVSLLYDGVIAGAGLRSTQMAVLIHVARHGQPTMGELAAHLVLDRSALSDNLKPLIRDGLVDVRPCEMDKRGRRVRLTEAGYAKLTQAMGLWRTAQRRFDAAFGADEAHLLNLALERIADDGFVAAFEDA
jgi:DNA-binding MarR family transcriptional regulator